MSLNETGVTVVATGSLIMLLGSLLLFDTALIIIGNFLVVAGLVVLLRSRTFNLFKIEKIQGTLFFCLGVFVLFFKYFLFGMLLECLGLFIIFKSSMPDVRSIFYRLLFTKFSKRN